MPPSPIQDYLESLRTRLRDLNDGNVADYIPELARVDPDAFGICIATHDGFVYEVGDSRQPFTIQSISKPLTYGLALEDNGEAAVLARSASSRPATSSTRSACGPKPVPRSIL